MKSLVRFVVLLLVSALSWVQPREVRAQSRFEEAVRAASPSVVRVSSNARSLFTGRPVGFVASGVILTDDGYIVTCASALGTTPQPAVLLDDGSEVPARVVKTDPAADLAVLKIDRTGLAPIRMKAEPQPSVGQWVLLIGNPFGLARTRTDPLSASVGVVSGVRPVSSEEFKYAGPVILTDVTVNPGATGGAVVDLEGRLVGVAGRVVTSTRTNTQLSFALPAAAVQKLLNEAKASAAAAPTPAAPQKPEEANRGYLGAYILDETEGTQGACIQRVLPGSPAQAAGLADGDLVTGMDGTGVANGRQFIERLDRLDAGAHVEMTVRRNNRDLKVTATLGKPVRPVLK